MQVLGTFGDQQPDDGPSPYQDGSPPAMPSWDDSVVTPMMVIGESPVPPLVDKIDLRMRPEDRGFRHGDKTGRAEIAGWLGFADGTPFDAFSLLFACDAFPPPVFNTDVAPRLGAHRGTHGSRSASAGPGAGALCVPQPVSAWRAARRRRRGLGLCRHPGGAVASTGADPALIPR